MHSTRRAVIANRTSKIKHSNSSGIPGICRSGQLWRIGKVTRRVSSEIRELVHCVATNKREFDSVTNKQVLLGKGSKSPLKRNSVGEHTENVTDHNEKYQCVFHLTSMSECQSTISSRQFVCRNEEY